jgi:hypothetical protein
MTRTLIVGAAMAVLAGSASANHLFVGAADFRGFNNDSGDFGFAGSTYETQRSAFLNAPGFQSFTDSLEGFNLDPAQNESQDVSTGFNLNFGGGVSATVGLTTQAGDGFDPALISNYDLQNPGENPNGNRRDGTDGANMFYTGLTGGSAGTLDIDFDPSTVVRGFGFSIVDLGDFGATMRITLQDGSIEVLDLASDEFRADFGLDSTDFENGDTLWLGFVADSAIAGVEIVMSNNGTGDRFSFDEFTVLVVPVPPAFALAGLGLVGVALRRRKMMAG